MIEPGAGLDERPARLRHLGAVDGEIAVDVQRGGRAKAGAVQHGRPKQAVEIDDVLAQKMMQLGLAVGAQVGVEVDALGVAQRLEAGQVADRRVQPDVEKLARRIGNGKAEVGRIAADVPVAQAAIDPFHQLGLDRRVGAVALQPVAQKGLEIAQLKEIMLRLAQLRHRAGHRRTRVLQVGRGIGGTAHFAIVAVLIGRAALGALALDVAVGQKHAALGVVELGDAAPGDVATVAQGEINAGGDLAVFLRVGGVVMIEGHPEFGEIALVTGLDFPDEGFRRHPGLFSGQHDRRAVGIVGADVPDRAALHAPGACPDIGLDVTDQMADVQRAVGIGQGAGDESGRWYGHDRRG